MEKQIFLTENGLGKLKTELENLKERRRKVVERIKIAREFGDLSENSEYEDARNEQSFVEGRIQEVEEMLSRAKIVAKNGNGGGKADLGSEVTLRLDGQEFAYELVGANESDPSSGKISIDSPLGNALIGKAKGEKVEIKTPNGQIIYDIVAIK